MIFLLKFFSKKHEKKNFIIMLVIAVIVFFSFHLDHLYFIKVKIIIKSQKTNLQAVSKEKHGP